MTVLCNLCVRGSLNKYHDHQIFTSIFLSINIYNILYKIFSDSQNVPTLATVLPLQLTKVRIT